MKKTILFAISALLISMLIGCSSGCSSTTFYTYKRGEKPTHISSAIIIPIWIDKDFSFRRVESIKKAIAEWNNVLNGQIILRQDGEFTGKEEALEHLEHAHKTHQGWVIIKFESDDPVLLKMVDDVDGKLAFVSNIGTGNLMVVINDNIGLLDLRTIVLHEIGHLLGAQHINTNSLMAPEYKRGFNEVSCVDKITAAQVASYNHLDLKTLNYCTIPNFE